MRRTRKEGGISRREFLRDSTLGGVGTTVLSGAEPVQARAGADFYVAIDGDDSWSGRVPSPNAGKTDGPFRSFGRAREAIRQLKANGRFTKAVIVMIRDGTYFLSEPFVLYPGDSGTKERPVTYTAYPGEKPVLSGGKMILGWKVGKGKLWTAEVPEVKAGKLYFRQLFVNGQRRDRARLPKEGYYGTPEGVVPEAHFVPLGAESNNSINLRAFRYKPGEIRRGWTNLEDVEVVVLQFWTEARLLIEEINEATRIVTFTGSSFRPLAWSKGYYVENVYEGLSRPGQWYLDRKTGLLSYWPLPGEDMTRAKVIAPVAEQLLGLQGDVEHGRFVEHIALRGLAFHHTAWTLPEMGYVYPQAEVAGPAFPYWLSDSSAPVQYPQSAERVPAAIAAEGVLQCCIEDNELAHLGAWGIELGRGSKDNRIVGNRIYDVGGGGIKIGEPINRKRDEEEASRTLVVDNVVADGCRVYLGAPGIWIGQSGGNRIAHNEIRGAWEWGISAGWTWNYMPPNRSRDNVLEYNHIHDLGHSALGTHGAIYTLGLSPGTIIRYNLIHDLSGEGTGIILDNGSSAILVENNVVYNADRGGLNTNFNVLGAVVRNNIFALGKEAQLWRYGDLPHIDPPPPNANFFYNNIVFWREGKLYGDKKWPNFDLIQDYNLYYDASGRPVEFLTYSFQEWKEQGLDRHSVIADPLFVDPEKGNFTLRPESPALNLGFQPIHISRIGPRPLEASNRGRPTDLVSD